MNIYKIIDEFEKFAPLSLSEAACKNLDLYDNSGWIIKTCDQETKCVIFALDLTKKAVEKAVETGAKLIITHHPAIYRPIKNLTYDSSVFECANNGISVYSSHLSLDTADGGIEDGLCALLGGKNAVILEKTQGEHGFGRIFNIEADSFGNICRKAKEIFNTDKILSFGEDDRMIHTVASFCGAGLSEQEIEKAEKAQLLISADVPHHVILSALEKGKCVLQLTHYASEFYAFRRFCELFVNKTAAKYNNDKKIIFDKNNSYFYVDERFL